MFQRRGDNTWIYRAREPPATYGHIFVWRLPEGILEGLAAIDESVFVWHFDLHEGLLVED
ncbi:MAG: hypothetical protein ACI80L_002476 [Pseudohongiellaceae bacterium]|jgi:hypothetical protein